MPARAASKKRSVVCAGPKCKVRFTPQRSTAKYHAAACREAARRARQESAEVKPARKAAAKKAAPAKSTPKAKVESAANKHDLVVALRKELEDAQALDTFEGQLALELAKRLVAADSPASSLADKVRDARQRALEQSGTKPPTPTGEPVEEEDEVTRARKQREEARQAAGLS